MNRLLKLFAFTALLIMICSAGCGSSKGGDEPPPLPVLLPLNPELLYARPIDEENVDLLFNKEMNHSSLNYLNYYSISPPVNDLKINFISYQRYQYPGFYPVLGSLVRLFSRSFSPGEDYTVRVNQVEDVNGNIIQDDKNSAVFKVPILEWNRELIFSTFDPSGYIYRRQGV